MATGRKTDSGNIAWSSGDSAAGRLQTIAERLRAERNFAVGVVSTVPFSHATPAAFVSHNVDRNHYYTGRTNGGTPFPGIGIADEIVFGMKPEVVIGGGHPGLIDPYILTSQNLGAGYISASAYAQLRSSSDYVFVERTSGVSGGAALLAAADVASANRQRLFGLFGGASGAFGLLISLTETEMPSTGATRCSLSPQTTPTATCA
jgi:alkaline phosphatase